MVILKIAGIFSFILLFFGLFVFGPVYDRIPVQAGVFVCVVAWSTLRFSLRETASLIKFCLPFLFTLMIFGIAFQLIRLQGREDWIADTLIKCLIFPSSLIFLKILLTYITYLDILRLPVPMKRRIDLITIKSAFGKGGAMLNRFLWYLDTYPGIFSGTRARKLLIRYACLVIALYLYLYEEIEDSNRLLRNRYHHLLGGEK